LIDRSGNVVARYHHRTKPLSNEVIADVERVLASN
jgi:glutathione peroxidase